VLRISQVKGDDSIPTLKVEGKLRGPWVAELARACDELQGSSGCVSLDLSAVIFVDTAGVELLRALLGRGVTLAACSGLVAELLHTEGR
jgi:ABC-type transporter Mla MlaB component